MADPASTALQATIAVTLLGTACALAHAVFVSAWHTARTFFRGDRP